MKASLIIPVFNAERFLPECIDSILAQSFQDFELILLDDGSKDNSGRICDEYATKDSRIQVLHQPNGGVTVARSNGVNNAKGDWIVFVDADDTIPVNALQTLMENTDDSTDIVVARYDDRKYPESMSLDEYRRCCISGRKVHCGPFARAFRSRLFTSYTFDIPREIIRGEDMIMNVRLAFATESPPVLVDKKVYNYRQNVDSVMHTQKHTVAYSTIFFQYLCRSIPNPDNYQQEMIARKLSSIHNIVIDAPNDGSWRKSDFWTTLQKQINDSCYNMSIEERIMLKPTGKKSLRIAIWICHIISVVKRILPF